MLPGVLLYFSLLSIKDVRNFTIYADYFEKVSIYFTFRIYYGRGWASFAIRAGVVCQRAFQRHRVIIARTPVKHYRPLLPDR